MSGGIIITRRNALITAAKDSSLYDNLPSNCKNKIDAIDAKPPAQCTEEDLRTLVRMLKLALDC